MNIGTFSRVCDAVRNAPVFTSECLNPALNNMDFFRGDCFERQFEPRSKSNPTLFGQWDDNGPDDKESTSPDDEGDGFFVENEGDKVILENMRERGALTELKDGEGKTLSDDIRIRVGKWYRIVRNNLIP